MGRPLASLLLAYVSSVSGDWCFKIALPVIVLQLTGSAFLMAAAFACNFAPYVLIMPLGGALADALPRQKVLYTGDFLSAAVSACVCIYLASGGRNMFIIFPLIFALGTIAAVYHPAFQGFIPSAVMKENLPRANAIFTAGDNILNTAGPMLAGVMVALFDPLSILWANVFSFLISAIVIFTIKPLIPEIQKRSRITVKRISQDVKDGFRIAWKDSVIRWGTIIFVGENFATNMILANEIFFLTQILHFSIAKAGILMGLSAAVAILGSFSTSWLMSRYRTGTIILTFMGIITLGASILLTAYWVPVLGILIGRSFMMAARAIIIVAMFSYRQLAIPQEYLSRVVAIQRTCAYSAVPISAIIGGLILTTYADMWPVLVFAAAVLAISTLIGVMSPLNSLHKTQMSKKSKSVT